MSSALKYVCPVCGFLLDEPAEDFNICPSCGVEFDADTVEYTIGELQGKWIARGMEWSSPVLPKPADYNPQAQLARLRFRPQSAVTGDSVRKFGHFDVYKGTSTPANRQTLGKLRLIRSA